MITVRPKQIPYPIRLSIHRLSDLKAHERIIPSELDSLAQDMNRTGFQRDPILIDSKSHVVLDGMHRRAALERLRMKYALCAEYDYFSDEVILQRWLRYMIAPSKSLLTSIRALFHLKPCSSSREAILYVDSGRSAMGVLSAENSMVSEERKTPVSSTRIVDVYERINEFDALCKSSGVEIGFVGEGEKTKLYSSKSVYVLYPVPIGKSQIIAFAKKGHVLPFKTTRHIVPVRPMGVYFPLENLKNSNLAQCNEILQKIVALSTVKLERRNVWYEGRKYNEPLAVFRGN